MDVIDSKLVNSFAKNLKARRTKAAISQEELALKCGLDRTYISGCERGVRNPSLISVEKIADALSVSASSLLEVEQ